MPHISIVEKEIEIAKNIEIETSIHLDFEMREVIVIPRARPRCAMFPPARGGEIVRFGIYYYINYAMRGRKMRTRNADKYARRLDIAGAAV